MAGMNGQQIYHNFQDGQGPDGLVGGAAIVNEVAADYDTRAQQIRSLMTRMESAWQGNAAGAAHRGAGPMANEHELSGPSLATAQDLTNRQAGSYADAKNAVVPVPPKPELANPLVVFSSPAEWARFEDQVDDYNAAAQHNVDVMNRYGGASAYNIRELPYNYGTLTTDQAGISVGPDTTIDSEDVGDTGSDSGGPGGPGGSPSPRPGGGDTDGVVSGGGEPGGSSADTTRPDAGTTTPDAFTPGAPTLGTPATGGTDSGMGTGRPPSGLVPGVGVLAGPGAGGSPGGGSGSGAGPGGGRAGGGAGPRGGVVRGPSVGAESPAPAARSGPSGGMTGAPGRGGPGMSGVPIGAAGRGRDGEDSERKRPAYLEGGDPDVLFDTDEKTAPPAIGEDDDE